MKYLVVKLIAIFLGIKVASIFLGDIGLIPNPAYIITVTVMTTAIGYLACKLFYNGLLSVIEDHRSPEEQDRNPIL